MNHDATILKWHNNQAIPDSPSPKKAHQVKPNVKSMLICIFAVKGVFHYDFVLQSRAVNQNFYLEVL